MVHQQQDRKGFTNYDFINRIKLKNKANCVEILNIRNNRLKVLHHLHFKRILFPPPPPHTKKPQRHWYYTYFHILVHVQRRTQNLDRR